MDDLPTVQIFFYDLMVQQHLLYVRQVHILMSGPVGSIIYADLYRSMKIKFPVLIPLQINKDLCGSMRINFDQF